MQPDLIAQAPLAEPVFVMNLAGAVVLTLIPAVVFALWCDYFEKYLDYMKEEGEKIESSDELYRIRTANLFAMIFQVMIFFWTSSVRREHPFIGYPLFLSAMIAQFWLQTNLEHKVRTAPISRGAYLAQAARTFLWSAAAGAIYLFTFSGTVIAFSLFSAVIKAPAPIGLSIVVLGGVLGIVLGIGVSFKFGPFFARKILRATEITQDGANAALYSDLNGIFAETGSQSPAYCLVDFENYPAASAMMAGFRNGRGIFRQTLFISKGMIDALPAHELRAVILHEISHVQLEHLRNRLTFSTGLIVCGTLFTGLALLFCRVLDPAGEFQAFVGGLSIAGSFLSGLYLLGKQTQYQEIAADIHAVEKLGAGLENLSSALRALDRLNGQSAEKKDLGSRFLTLGHPATERRIRILDHYFSRKKELEKSATAGDSKAA